MEENNSWKKSKSTPENMGKKAGNWSGFPTFLTPERGVNAHILDAEQKFKICWKSIEKDVKKS